MNSLSKLIIATVIIVSIMLGTFYFIGQEKSGSVMDVSVDVFLDNGGNAHITNIKGDLRDVTKVSIPKGNNVIAPGVVAVVIYKQRLIGYWTSAGINLAAPLNSVTTYNLTVGLSEKPANGDYVSISAKLVGFGGEELDSVMTTFKIP